MRRLLLAGGIVQLSSALTLAVQNVCAPMLIGADAYGRGVGLIATPLLLQGLLEPMMNGVAIASTNHPDRLSMLGQSWRHVLLWIVISLVSTMAIAVSYRANMMQALLLAGFVIIVAINTALRSIAFADRRYRLLSMHYLAASAATIAALPLLWYTGVTGYLAMHCFTQFAVLFVLLRDQELNRMVQAVCQSGINGAHFTLWPVYIANLSSRLAQNVLGPGMILLASLQLAPQQLAEFRLLQTISGALAYALPLNATLLQASVRQGIPFGGTARKAHPALYVFMFLSVVFCVGILFWFIYPIVMTQILGIGVGVLQFRFLTLVSLLYVLVPIAAGVLLGRGYEKYVVYINFILMPIIIAAGFFWGVDDGFFYGCILYCLAYGYRLTKLT